MIKTSFSRRLFLFFDYCFFILCMLLCIYPIWFIFISSVSGPTGIAGLLLPKNFSLSNYIQLLEIKGIYAAFFMSVARTVSGTFLTVMTSMFLGYLFTKEKMPFKKVLYRMLMITMYVGGGLIPVFLVIRAYHMLNTFWVYIIPGMVSAYYVILIKTYIEQIPASVEESAMIDGAGVITIFLKIILPMSMPIVATIAVFAGVGQWNSWFDNYIYTYQSDRLLTLQYMLYRYLNQAETLMKQVLERGGQNIDVSKLITPRGIRMTVTMITVIPVMCIYPFLQKYFVKGIMIGAIKG